MQRSLSNKLRKNIKWIQKTLQQLTIQNSFSIRGVFKYSQQNSMKIVALLLFGIFVCKHHTIRVYGNMFSLMKKWLDFSQNPIDALFAYSHLSGIVSRIVAESMQWFVSFCFSVVNMKHLVRLHLICCWCFLLYSIRWFYSDSQFS